MITHKVTRWQAARRAIWFRIRRASPAKPFISRTRVDPSSSDVRWSRKFSPMPAASWFVSFVSRMVPLSNEVRSCCVVGLGCGVGFWVLEDGRGGGGGNAQDGGGGQAGMWVGVVVVDVPADWTRHGGEEVDGRPLLPCIVGAPLTVSSTAPYVEAAG